MLRFYFVIICSIPLIISFLIHCHYIEHHDEDYSEIDRYKIAQHIVRLVKRKGFITTKAYGMENLPKEGGYVMYPNHQGKYDAMGIIDSHQQPCTILMDEKRSHVVVMSQFLDLIKGVRIDRDSIEAQVKLMKKVSGEVKEGRRYIIFPEGGYFHNRNDVKEFMPGAFKYAMRAHAPIVPVVLIDSYKPFECNSLLPVTTKVFYLKPLLYDDYKGMSTTEISDYVREQIRDTIRQESA